MVFKACFVVLTYSYDHIKEDLSKKEGGDALARSLVRINFRHIGTVFICRINLFLSQITFVKSDKKYLPAKNDPLYVI